MVTIILTTDGATNETLSQNLASLISAGDTERIAISSRSLSAPGIISISSTGRSFADTIREALKRSRGSSVLLLDGSSTIDGETLSDMLNSIREHSGSELIFFPEGNIESFDPSPEEVINRFIQHKPLPQQALAISRSTISLDEINSSSIAELIGAQLIKGITEQRSITESPLRRLLETSSSSSLSNEATSRLLSTLIAGCNIEDIFPTQDWQNHQNESASASYHSLGALFVRLNDMQSALQCLNIGDRFQESPRSLALRGLIAGTNGEMLGAVANMVSSLQQYENTKKTDKSLSTDFEVINEKLIKGLDALNRRDNEEAFEHFSEAVFNFDPFYSKMSISRTRRNER